jgi:hypothetical protein
LPADGRFAFTGIPGGPRNLVLRGKATAEHRMQVDVKAGEDHDVGVIKLAAGHTLGGRVVDGKDKPLADVEIVVHGDAMSELRTATGDDGAFSVVVPGDRDVVVEARARRGGMTRTTVAAGASASLVLRIVGTSTVEGAVTVAGEPLVDAIVALRKPDDHSERPYSYAQTDGAGFYRLQGIDPGSYELQVVHQAKTTSQPIDVKAGTNFSNIELPR